MDGIIIINKPKDNTSHDIVYKVKMLREVGLEPTTPCFLGIKKKMLYVSLSRQPL